MEEDTLLSLDKINTVFFCDESKYHTNNGELENAFYYFAIEIDRNLISEVNFKLKSIFQKCGMQADVFHSSKIFSEKNTRNDLIRSITGLILDYKLKCICYKYQTDLAYPVLKKLNYLNDGGKINFNNAEFQALFFFVALLNSHLIEFPSQHLRPPFAMYFDKGIYGKKETDAIDPLIENYVIEWMSFTDKREIDLLALPDFFGYMFRKVKIMNNKIQFNIPAESSLLTEQCKKNLEKLVVNHLFIFIDLKEYLPLIDNSINKGLRR